MNTAMILFSTPANARQMGLAEEGKPDMLLKHRILDAPHLCLYAFTIAPFFATFFTIFPARLKNSFRFSMKIS
jgi:hypothetical protein